MSGLTARRLLTGYFIWMAVLAAAEFAYPSLRLLFWSGIGITSAIAVLVGVFRNRPRRRLPWLLVSLALLVFTAGDATWIVLARVLDQANPFPSAADVLYLAMYPLLVAGLMLLPRSATGRERAAILDALVLTAAVGLLVWVFLISPNLHDGSLDPLARLTSIAYPLFDLLLLAAAARLVSAVRATTAVVLMTVGMVSLLVTDVVYGLSQLRQDWNMGTPIDAGWIIFYVSWGAAALHPSMTELTEPRVVRPSEVTPARMAVLTLSALVAPLVLFFEEALGNVTDAMAIAALSATIFLLVLLRLAGVVRTNRQATQRERVLREAGAALAAAQDFDAVRAAVLAAVDRLFRAVARHEAVLSLPDAAEEPLPAERPRFVRTADLPPAARELLGEFELALVNPLARSGGPAETLVDRPRIGTLIVAADDAGLGAQQGAVGALASQAALTVERITMGAEIARRNSEEYFRTLVHNTADVILILDDDNRIRYASPSAAGMFGTASLSGVPIRRLIQPTHREPASHLLTRVRTGGEGSVRAHWTVIGSARGTVEAEVSGRDLRRDPTVAGLVLTLRDVTEQRELERELKHRALHDSLTGLPNRILFTERAEQAVAKAAVTETVTGVLAIDLDDFKVANDSLGHEFGDQLLTVVGDRLTGLLGPSDTAARIGGDEFGLLIENAHDADEIERVAERAVQALGEPIAFGSSQLTTSASIGLATTVDVATSPDLMREANLALNEAKDSGKRRWHRYQSSLHASVVARLAMRADLDQALAASDFKVQYQPIVRLGDGVTVGFEALARWLHPTRGMVPPGEFIDVAEDTGLIVPLGNWVLHESLVEALGWIGAAPHEFIYLSVNVSARQFRSPGFIDRVREELAATGLPPGRLMLEITESLLLRDDEQVWTDLTALRETGIRVAIDDFGTGYSSLSYLRQVPIDVVKIDKSFIDTMATSPQQRALVEGIVRLAHTLGLQVIAEGVQRPSDRDLLVEVGCSFGQGYLYAGAMSDRDALSWLRTDLAA